VGSLPCSRFKKKEKSEVRLPAAGRAEVRDKKKKTENQKSREQFMHKIQ
jgi:hypothetical protein